MALENLERLVQRRLLSRHRATRREIENHARVAREFAAAADLPGVAESVRFNNLYDAAHAAALAGLKLAGYRAPDGEGNRQLALSCVEQTLALEKGSSAAFVEANRLRSCGRCARGRRVLLRAKRLASSSLSGGGGWRFARVRRGVNRAFRPLVESHKAILPLV